MGRKKIDMKRIANDRMRQITFCKRKKGLFKKALEISQLCDVRVCMLINDTGRTKIF